MKSKLFLPSVLFVNGSHKVNSIYVLQGKHVLPLKERLNNSSFKFYIRVTDLFLALSIQEHWGRPLVFVRYLAEWDPGTFKSSVAVRSSWPHMHAVAAKGEATPHEGRCRTMLRKVCAWCATWELLASKEFLMVPIQRDIWKPYHIIESSRSLEECHTKWAGPVCFSFLFAKGSLFMFLQVLITKVSVKCFQKEWDWK